MKKGDTKKVFRSNFMRTQAVQSQSLLSTVSFIRIASAFNGVVNSSHYYFFPCGAAAQRGPWPPHS